LIIRCSREARQRLQALAAEDELGASGRQVSPSGALAEHLLGIAQLDALVGGKRATQELERALGGAHQVDEPPLRVAGESHPHSARAAIDPAQHTTLGGAEFGGEAQHLVGRGVELIGRDDGHSAAVAKRAVGREQPLHSQRRGDSERTEREGCERLSECEGSAEGDRRYRLHHSGGKDESEDRQHRPGIVWIEALHDPTSM
jgi:hypothetical protein